jgi:mannose-1-phosphate guanylyltransferase
MELSKKIGAIKIKDLSSHLFVLILCGGGGKRLWPRSRVRSPKQFIKLFNSKTIFQETIARSKNLVPFSRIFVVTNFDYTDEVAAQAPEIPRENIIAEPMAKNTAMAVGMGAIYIQRVDPLAVITNFASDHRISQLDEFNKAIILASQAANLGDYLVTVGIKPTFPHTGMGYIKAIKLLQKVNGAKIYNVERFVEKPDVITAKRLLGEGGYFWNANLYTWRADSILRALDKYLPKTARGLEEIRMAIKTAGEKRVTEGVYKEAEDISIDVGVSEKSKNMLLIPAEFSWSDVGDWKVAYDVSDKDKDGNVVICEKGDGEYIGLDSKNCLIHFSDQLIATIGVDNLIIVDTKDALLVARKDRAEEVKRLVELLKKKGKTEYL